MNSYAFRAWLYMNEVYTFQQHTPSLLYTLLAFAIETRCVVIADSPC